MTVEFITFFAVGLLLIVLGLLTWKKQRVTIIHEYHRKNVKKEDLPEYAREMGIATLASAKTSSAHEHVPPIELKPAGLNWPGTVKPPRSTTLP